ncbi:MAG: Rieske 2Fe-2S domain-containing protein [Burkholderiales bacterium]
MSSDQIDPSSLEAVLYPAPAHYGHRVAYAANVHEQPVGATLLNQPVVVFRQEGKLVAKADRCLHRGARLSPGRVVPEGIECAYGPMLSARMDPC